ncbi:uncharacterized protein LOC124090181 isoform X2 [Marmota monax]|uniref:uncharacterized protein LOC124090181 isoform X2 n=1 Tax=Marmota monax TaxID=9995 RepID=UPI001EB09C88|nr:uncharacterized protein LOC124090181 isoform X2 [Marmota monax]
MPLSCIPTPSHLSHATANGQDLPMGLGASGADIRKLGNVLVNLLPSSSLGHGSCCREDSHCQLRKKQSPLCLCVTGCGISKPSYSCGRGWLRGMMRYQPGALRDDRPIEKESQGVDSRSDTDGEGRSEAQMPHAGPSFSSCLCRARGESRPSRCSQPHLAPGGVPVGLDLCCALDLHAPTCALDKGSLAALSFQCSLRASSNSCRSSIPPPRPPSPSHPHPSFLQDPTVPLPPALAPLPHPSSLPRLLPLPLPGCLPWAGPSAPRVGLWLLVGLWRIICALRIKIIIVTFIGHLPGATSALNLLSVSPHFSPTPPPPAPRPWRRVLRP